MGTAMAARQVLRWTVRTAASSLFSPPLSGRCHLQPLCVGCGWLSSSSSQSTPQSTQHNDKISKAPEKPVTEQSLQPLIDLGFTDIQAEQMHEVVSKVRGESAAKHALPNLATLLVLGLNPASVLKLLQKCPELCAVKDSLIQQRIDNLRKQGLVEGSLQRVVAHCPQILTMPAKTIKYVVMFLREKCLFTTQQVTEILRDSPSIILEDLGQVEYKFQYVYFRMGIKQAEMMKAGLFRFSLDEIRCRHCFLERRGLYQTPDKKGQTTLVNPKLDRILTVDRDTFLAAAAKASAEEYEVFQRLLAREWQAQEEEYGSFEADSDDDEEEEEEEEEEDEETGGKSAYRKRRRK